MGQPNFGRQRAFASIAGPALGGLLALALYASTLPKGLTWAHNGADGGDLLAAVLTGGVPHPTGYPTHQILLRVASAFALDEPARAGAWLSALSAALAVWVAIDLARRVITTRPGVNPTAASASSVIAGLTWAASWTLWGQATIVEVYSLNLLFATALLWLAWRWAEALHEGVSGRQWLVSAGLLLGVGLGNHLTLALVLPGIVAWIGAKGRGKRIATDLRLAGAGMLLGLLVYAYLPLAASRRPPINWGDPVTLDRFLWLISGRLYGGLAFGLPLAEVPARLTGWASLVLRDLMPWGLIMAVAGLWLLQERLRDWWLATLLVALTFTAYGIGYNTTDSYVYLLPAFAVTALWLGEGLAGLFTFLARRRIALASVGLALFAMMVVAPVAWNWRDQREAHDGSAELFADLTLEQAEPNALLLTANDATTFALWYAVYGLDRRSDIAIVNVNLYPYDWYRQTLAETHPDLLPSAMGAPAIETLIAAQARYRPVYAVEDLNLNLPVKEERVGLLTRLVSP